MADEESFTSLANVLPEPLLNHMIKTYVINDGGGKMFRNLLKLKHNAISACIHNKMDFPISGIMNLTDEKLRIDCLRLALLIQNSTQEFQNLLGVFEQRLNSSDSWDLAISIKDVASSNVINGHISSKNLKSLVLSIIENAEKSELLQIFPFYLKTAIDCDGTFFDTAMNSIIEKENLKLLSFCIADLLVMGEQYFHEDNFWIFLNDVLRSNNEFKIKQILFILRESVQYSFERIPNYLKIVETDHFGTISIWNDYFTLMEISREKQLHLIEPSLKLLDSCAKMHQSWQSSLYKILLNHSQLSIVHKVTIRVLGIDEFETDLKLSYIYPALNKYDYSSAFFRRNFIQMNWFVSQLKPDERDLIFKNFLKIEWNPKGAWFCLKSILCFRNYFECPRELVGHVLLHLSKLPHLFIRFKCLKVFLMGTYMRNDSDDENLIKTLLFLAKYAEEALRVFLILNSKKKSRLSNIFNLLIDQFNWSLEFKNVLKQLYDNPSNCSSQILTNILKYSEVISLNVQKILISFSKGPHVIDENFLEENSLNLLSSKESLCCAYFINILKVKSFDGFYDCKIVNVKKYSSFLQEVWNNKIKFFKNAKNFIDLSSLNEPLLRKFNVLMENLCPYFYRVPIWTQCFKTLEEMIKSENEELICEIIPFLYWYSKYRYQNSDKLFRRYLITVLKLSPVHLNYCIEFIIANKLIFFNVSYESNKIIFNRFDTCVNLLTILINHPVSDECSEMKLKEFSSFISESKNYYDMNIFVRTFLDNLTSNIIVTKADRSDYDVCQDISQHVLSILGPEDDIQNPYKIKTKIRFLAMGCLYESLRNEIKAGSDEGLRIVLKNLIELYKTHYKKRYFPNSQIHLEKLRVVQALSVIVDLIKEPSELANFIIESFCEEIHQPCVRQIMQMILIRLVTGHPSLREVIEEKINDAESSTPSSIYALLPVLYHSNPGIGQISLIKNLLPWSMGSNFKIRAYAQILIMELFEKSREGLEEFEFIHETTKEVLSKSGNSIRDVLKNDYIFLRVFDPKLHYNRETIFYDIPRLHNVINSEWENTHFLKLDFFTFEGARNNEFSLAVNEELVEDSKVDVLPEPFTNIQKKITVPLFEGKNLSELIVIGSLIEKSSNLGGISRTCEVFGVKKLIVHNAKIIEDKEFKSLSMSSEHWVRFEEVKKQNVLDYVLKLKNEGYFIVGLEQTAESVELNRFNFEKKTALLLGNEKQGINPQLLSIMNRCVEIPQFGRTRSLNVHVAAATCIWEYVKQNNVFI